METVRLPVTTLDWIKILNSYTYYLSFIQSYFWFYIVSFFGYII